ncbi:MAG: Histidine biosynthesis protein [Candidatus Argoarchaeum ethanivorans]|uniref:Histidine biosynthesis protein n=1 Tax=Candidatus Argoarchaeum ethanivorans TaxID=2608793 RepID=A0A811TE23_9EURY|nr:MAG: Histidine biosynthesis protein [Candidatus Argoarchaeum ethanivorans]
MFQIVFVLDILNGIVLHASGGRRENYKPIHITSKVCDSPDPLEIIKQLKPEQTYVADLNRLQKTGTDNYRLIKELSKHTVLMADTGITTIEDLEPCLAVSNTAVIGTETADINTIINASKRFPGRVNVSIDIKHGRVLATNRATLKPIDIVSILNKLEINRIIVLDLDRVGTSSGFNIELLEELCTQSEHDILVGGGIRNMKDIETLDNIGVRGALIATAIHNGSIPTKILNRYQ